MKASDLVNLEKGLQYVSEFLPPRFVVTKYSKGRLRFLEELKEELSDKIYSPAERFSRKLWGIKFRSPIINAAGMFKNGECYEMTFRQGAGAYLAGTGTWNKRKGNEKDGICLPFVAYRRSHAASNWLGLPNDGDEINSQRAAMLEKREGCPIGWSVMGSPDFEGENKLIYLVKGMKLYENSGVDFIEMNESCPNTAHGKGQDNSLKERLRYVKENFLSQRKRRLPAIVKFSNDTKMEQVPFLLDLLFELGYDGVNFGNSSTSYKGAREKINEKERKLYDFFVSNFGGGVTGRPLKETSLALASRAVEYVKMGKPKQEFHVIRTGGIEHLGDIEESERAGISLNQWFSGYFEGFEKYLHDVYRKTLEPNNGS